jgi:hypothetical protein
MALSSQRAETRGAFRLFLPYSAPRSVLRFTERWKASGGTRCAHPPVPSGVHSRSCAVLVIVARAAIQSRYTREVIDGAEAFALQCQDYQGFADAMQQKLQREIAAAIPERAGFGTSG